VKLTRTGSSPEGEMTVASKNRMSSNVNGLVALRAVAIPLATGQMAVATAALTALLLARPQRYDQFVVGNLPWTGASKTWEIPAALCFVIAIPVFWRIHALVEARLARAGVGRTGLCLLLGACAPGLVLFAQSLAYPSLGSLRWLGVAVPLDVLWIAISSAYALGGTSAGSAAVLQAAYLSAIMAGFSMLGVTLAASRLFNFGTAFPAWPIGAAIAGCACVGWLAFAPAWRKSKAFPEWSRLLVACQAGIPFLAAGLIPTPFSTNEQSPQATHGVAVLALTLAVGACAVADLVRCARKKSHRPGGIASNPDSWTPAGLPISPAALLLCAWIIRTPFTPIPAISLDDWHFGETLLPYAVWHDFGELPFANVMPVRGFISVVNAAVAASFFGADAADIGPASAIADLLFGTLIFIPVYAVAGALAAAFSVIAVDFSPLGQPDIVFGATFCTVSWFMVRGSNASAIVAWLLISPVFFLLAPAQGLIYGVATLPLVIAAAVRADRRGRIVASIFLLAVAAAVAIALATHTGTSVAHGVLRYATDNSRVMISANGTPWFAWYALSGHMASFAPELLRSFALPIAGGALVCATLFLPPRSALTRYDCWLAYIRSNAFVLMSIALSAALVGIGSLPRALYRIDPFEGSRIGNLTLLMLAGIAPVVVAQTRSLRRNLFLLPLAIAIAGGVKGMPVASDVFQSKLEPTAFLMPTLRTESNRPLIDASALGLVHMGTTLTEWGRLQRLLLLKKSIDALLPQGEPYYDLTNHNADYVYFGRPVPAAWSSPYYFPDERAQASVVEELRARGVKLLLLSASNITHDGGSNALRVYWLYRFVLADYVAFRFNGFLFAVRRDLAAEQPFRSILAGSAPSNDVFEAAFAERDLKVIPISWGGSFGSLSHLLEPIKVPLELQVGEQGVAAPPGFDLLHLELDCPADVVTEATLRWEGLVDGHTMSGVAQFTASSGTLLVPVGAYPSWILAERVANVTLEVDKCRVGSASLHRRIKPLL
jgi:hypothetical protein